MKKQLANFEKQIMTRSEMKKIAGGECSTSCSGTCDAGKYGSGVCTVTIGTNDCNCTPGSGGIQ